MISIGVGVGITHLPVLGSISASLSVNLDFAANSYNVNGTTYSSFLAIPGSTFTRTSTATRFNASGVLESVASGVMRLDHNPVTLVTKGVLIEEARTNSFNYSEEFDNAYWTKTGVTVTANAVTAPSGALTADTLTTSGTVAVQRLFRSIGVTGLQTCSFFAKAGTANFLQINNNSDATFFANFDLTTGVIGTVGAGATAQMTNVGGGWYRCSITVTVVSSLSWLAYIVPSNTSASAASYPATVSTLHLWGAQIEAGGSASSYIPTVAATATRAADSANITYSFAGPDGTLGAEFSQLLAASYTVQRTFAQLFALGGVQVALFRAATQNSLNALDYAAGAADGIVAGSAISDTNLHKGAAAFGVNDLRLVVNGGAAAADTTVTGATNLTELRIGNTSGTVNFANGHIKRIRLWNYKLTNSELQAETA